jgi:hypothetical protein
MRGDQLNSCSVSERHTYSIGVPVPVHTTPCLGNYSIYVSSIFVHRPDRQRFYNPHIPNIKI